MSSSKRLRPLIWRGTLGLFFGLGCGAHYSSQSGPALAATHPIAEGNTGRKPLEEDPEHLAAVAKRTPVKRDLQFAPDPPEVLGQDHVRFSLRYHGGEVTVAAVQRVHSDHPMAAARKVGRFALELWIGRELVDRVRFDFPLLGGTEPDPAANGDTNRPRFEAGADVEHEVQLPESTRATRAVIVDRATGEYWELLWPPELKAYSPTRYVEGRPPHSRTSQPSSR